MIAEVRKEPEQRQNIGNGWHTDHSYDTAPAMGSMLYAREVPATGGDTLFASMYAAYDALSDGLKATLDGLAGIAFEPARLRRRGPRPARRPQGPHRQPGARDTGRHPPRRHPPPGDRPQGALRQPGFHPALRRLDRGGITPVARLPLPARGPARVHLPLPLARGFARLLGQPLDLALRGQRLSRRASPLASHHDRGRAVVD